MKPYAEHKPTGLKWLPEVPAHWEVLRGKNLFSVVNERSEKGEEKLLSVSEHHGVIERAKADVTMFMAESYEGYKLCWPDDFVVNSLWAWSYGMGFSHDHGIISTAYSVYRLRDKSKFLPSYYNYFLRGTDFHWEMRVRSKGLWKSRYQLSDADFMSSPMVVPPPEEQAKIVSYLDAKTAKIDKLIKLKEREIELLQEKKQAVISHVVTRGLDPNVELVDSGVDGIGQIPKGWMVARLKDITRSNLESLSEKTSGDTRIRYIDIGSVGTGYIKIAPEEMDFEMAPSRARRLVREGDTIVSTVRTYLKSVLYISREISDCVVSTGFSVLRPNEEKVIPRFLGLMLIGDYFINAVIKDSTGVSYPAINDSKLAAIHVVVPTKEIQDQIIEFADTALQNVNCVISSCERQIALLKEYRTRLISDAVTGKIDLREVAG